MIRHRHSLLREATDVWLVGAGTVVVWFLLSDSIAGRPLYTPGALGQILLFVSAEVFFLGTTYALLSRTGAEALWGSLVVANLLAMLAIGGYLWRTHRLISRWLARVPLGDTGDEPEVTSSAAWHAMARWRAPWMERWTRPRLPGAP